MRSAGWGPGTGWHGGSGRSRSGRASSTSLPTGDGDMRSKPWVSKGSLLLIAALAMALFACSTPSGQAEATPSPLTFGPTPTGQSTTEQLVITNVATSGSLTVESMAISGPDAATFADQFDDDSAVVLAPDESLTVPVIFSPTNAGPRSAALHVNHSGSEALSVPLSGTAVDPDPGSAPLVAGPSSVIFPTTSLGQTANQDVVLRNGSPSGSLVIQSTSISGPDAAMFSDAFDDAAP